MFKSKIIITIALFALSLTTVQAQRQRLTFDQGWQFRLCKDKNNALEVLKSLGISDNPYTVSSDQSLDKKTKVTDDTEPEQAQVTASEITKATGKSEVGQGSSAFRSVTIPHDYSIELPFEPKMGGSAGYLAGGQGIYVKEFALPSNLSSNKSGKSGNSSNASLTNKKYTITFDGVYHRATVWLNGHRLGYHVYGYTGFSFDLTPYLNKDGKNILVVHVNREEQSRWYTGSGIYRHVWLDVTNQTRIKENSVFVKTDENNLADITCEIDRAPGDSAKKFKIVYEILDHDGKAVNGFTSTGKSKEGSLHHWSCEDPYLYTALVQLYDEKNKLVDEVRTPFGFRTIKFDADKGFFLNGKPMKLKGMCLHQDMGSLGVAVPEEYWESRLKAMKAIGCNAIRCSHNPPSPEFLNICDTLGLLVLDEAFDKWKSGYYSPFFDECAKQDISDMVLRDRNHPSVIIWSIGNEVKEAWASDNSGKERAEYLNKIVKSLDPTRPTLIACQQGFSDNIASVTDLVGYNYLEPRMIQDHKKFPQRKMLVTEAFAYYSGLRPDVVRDFVEENPWHFVEENDFIAGSFVWAGVDYLGESSPWPAKGWCSCPFDITMKERPQAAFYHPAWKPEEDYLKLVVRDNCFDQAMGTDHWQYPPMADTWDLPYKDSRCVQIRCYTTCDSVQFFFPMWSNPQLPLKPRVTKDYPDHCITIQLPARQGKVLAVGYKNGQPVMRDSLINHGDVANVRLECDNAEIKAQPEDFTEISNNPNNNSKSRKSKKSHSSELSRNSTVASLRLTLVDKDGLIQQMQPRKFRVEVEGPIRLLGVETGDMRREGSWRTTELNTYFGEGLVRLQSTTATGTAKVKIYVDGFSEPFIKEFTIVK